jgi:hypothetical protein
MQATPLGMFAKAGTWMTSKLSKPPSSHRDLETSREPKSMSSALRLSASMSTQTIGQEKETQTDKDSQKEEPKIKLKDTLDETKSFAEKFVLDDEQKKPFDNYEEIFWRKMISRKDYLKPLDYTDDEKEKIR